MGRRRGNTNAPPFSSRKTAWRPCATIRSAIRTEHWRYIRYDEGRAGEELYNLQDDPEEWRNLIGKSPKKAKELKAWLPSSYADAVPTKKAYHFDDKAYIWTPKSNPAKEKNSK